MGCVVEVERLPGSDASFVQVADVGAVDGGSFDAGSDDVGAAAGSDASEADGGAQNAADADRAVDASDDVGAAADSAGADAAVPDASQPPKADLFVATDGDDSWSGRLAAPNGAGDGPFATLDRARREVATRLPGHAAALTVMIRGGTYFLPAAVSFTATDSGSAAAPVIYQAYPGETPAFSGGKRLTGWTRGAGSLWTLSLPDVAAGTWSFNQLFVNGVRRYRPRTSAGYLKIAATVLTTDPQGAGCVAGTDAQSANMCFDRFRFSGTDILPSWGRPDDVELVIFEFWTVSRMRIKSVDAANHVVYFTGNVAANQWHRLAAGHRYLVENVKEALANPGDFYLDRGTGQLSYLAAGGEDPNAVPVIAPVLSQLVKGTNLSYVTFQGLTFEDTNWTVDPTGYRSGQADIGVPAALSFTKSDHLTFEGCTVSRTGGWGLELGAGCHDNLVQGCVVSDLGAGAVKLGATTAGGDTDLNVAQHNTVRESALFSGGRMLAAGPGVWIGNSHHNTVENDDLFDFYNTGISIGWVWGYGASCAHDNLVRLNHVHDLGQGVTSDLGGVYTLGIQPGTLIELNRIHDVTHDSIGSGGYGGWGVYFDEGSTTITAQNNLVYRTSTAGVHQNYGQDNQLLNNIFAFGALGEFDRNKNEDHLSFTAQHNVTYAGAVGVLFGNYGCTSTTGAPVPCADHFVFDHNLYFNPAGTVTFGGASLATWQGKGEDVNSKIADPHFNDPTHDDFSFADPSVAKSVGFVPFDVSGAGRTSGPPVTAVARAFP